MGLDIVNGTGNFVPWIKYNAKAGRWYIKGDAGDIEVQNPVFAADFSNIKTGWFYFSSGAAPEKVIDPSLTQRAPKPEKTYTDKDGRVKDCFKRGFLLNLYSKNLGGVVELSSTAAAISGPINDLYTAYESAAESKQGLVPVVAVKGAAAEAGKHGTNYKPIFSIEKWIQRPSEFDETGEGTSASVEEQSTPVQAQSVSEF